MAVVGTAARGLIIYQLESTPAEFKRIESPLKYQHRTVAIFRDKKKAPTGYALGSVEGRVAIQYVNPGNPKDNFTFKCHRSNGTPSGYQDIYAVSSIFFNIQGGLKSEELPKTKDSATILNKYFHRHFAKFTKIKEISNF